MADQLTLPELPAWLPLDPAAAPNQFEQSLHGKAQRERWKYTPMQKAWSNPELPGQTLLADHADELTKRHTDIGLPGGSDWWRQRLAQTPDALHRLCQAQTVNLIRIEPGASRTLNLQRQNGQAPTLIHVGENASVELTETLTDCSSFSDDVWLWLDTGARVDHSRNNLANGLDHCYRYLSVFLRARTHYHLHNHSLGAQLHRQDLHIDCAGADASVEVDMANWVAADKHLDQHTVINHQSEHSQSQQRVHTIAGDKATITFNGRIHIHPGAPKVSAHLNNRNLALSDRATINTKPELEIYTDDVECSHGATVGMLDSDHLFYFASRGVADAAARSLLARGFLRTCITGPLAESATTHLLDQDFEGAAA